MKCDKAQEFFSDYIENTLDRPMTVALESHLTGCEACTADVASLRSMWTVLDKVPAVEPPADFVWRTTTRLQNELLNRREAEQAKALPWWKRLTPIQSFSYAGIAALLVVGLAFPVSNAVQTWGLNGGSKEPTMQVRPPAASVTAPRFQVQLTGQGTASVTVTATSEMPSTRVVVTYLTPYNGRLVGQPRVWGQPVTIPAEGSITIPIAAGASRAVKIAVIARVDGTEHPFEKTLILPGAAPVTGASDDPYLALQQAATQTGRALLVDAGLTLATALDLQRVTLEQVLTQTGARTQELAGGAIAITR